MIILVLNTGSSSIKYQLINIDDEKKLVVGQIEKIGHHDSIHKYKGTNGTEFKKIHPIENHHQGIDEILSLLTSAEYGVIKSFDEIDAVGHRVVHGGEKFSDSVIINSEVENKIEENCVLAPLHNPHNLEGIKTIKKILPNVPNVAVFDTAFHQTMPPKSYIFPLSYEIYENYKIRKYGFHGTSHHYVAIKAAGLLNIPIEKCNFITCHLGNGSSVTAIQNGKSIDTSIGYGTLSGVMMGTRPGDFDPAVILSLINEVGMSMEEINHLLYKNSGLTGISGLSNDMRDLSAAAEKGSSRAKLALELYADKVKKYIGAYSVSLKQVNAIIFTAGIGENNYEAREMICDGLECLGAYLDKEKNISRGETKIVSTEDSPVKIIVIPTDEELMIAQETKKLIPTNKGTNK